VLEGKAASDYWKTVTFNKPAEAEVARGK
jgi:glycyl-tRNA synthetase alpha chain